MNNNTTKLGLIGLGAWGINYVKTIEKIKGVELVGISTKSGIIKKDFFIRKNYKIYKDWKDLVSKKNIDGVIIASPANTHFEITKYCINIRLPCIVEKPITLKKSQAKYIYEIAKKYKSIVLVDHIHLYNPYFKKLKKISQEAKNISSIHSVAGGHGPFRKDTRALWDWGSHDIAMSIDIMENTPEVVEASYLYQSNEKDKKGEIILTKLLFNQQKVATLIFGNLMKNKIRIFDLKADNKIIRYQPLLKKQLVEISTSQNNFKFKAKKITSPLSAMELLINEFRDLIHKKVGNYYDLKLALKVTSVIESISSILDLN